MNIIQRIIKRLKWELNGFCNKIAYKKYVKQVGFHVLTDEETINLLLDKEMSMARFGDGEYRLMNDLWSPFQKANIKLRDRLKEIIQSDNDKCLVCIPQAFVNHENLKRGARFTWYDFVKDNGQFVLAITPHKVFGEASCTRFYIDYQTPDHAIKVIPLLKKLWDKRDLCIVEGEHTKLGCGNDLFDNANSIVRIICPSTDAYDKYDEILSAVTTNIGKDKLILISLGMTATVLAYDLSLLGYQALDTGHVDIEYEWYKMGAKTKVAIKGKAVNECQCNKPESTIVDSNYETSILIKIM